MFVKFEGRAEGPWGPDESRLDCHQAVSRRVISSLTRQALKNAVDLVHAETAFRPSIRADRSIRNLLTIHAASILVRSINIRRTSMENPPMIRGIIYFFLSIHFSLFLSLLFLFLSFLFNYSIYNIIIIYNKRGVLW